MLNLLRTKKDNGKTLFALLDENHFPGIERTLFIHSLSETATSSIERNVNDLKFFLESMNCQGVDVDLLASKGQLPNENEINLFVQACKFERKTALEFISVRAKAYKNVKPTPLTEKQISDIQHKPGSLLKSIGTKSVNKRLNIAISYLTFIFNYHTKSQSAKQEQQLITTQGLIKEAIRRRSKARDNSAALTKTLSEEAFIKLLSLIDPTSVINPFKGSKLRNFLIFWVFITTGLRRGAVAKLKYSDLDFSGDRNKIYVGRTPDDPSDYRSRVASQKTNAHIAIIPSELMDDLKSYYKDSRKRYPEASKHEFIFVSEKNGRNHSAGDPLSLISYNKVFEKVRSRLEITTFHPHILRHHWHTLFEESVKDNNVSNDDKDKIRKEAMGWSRDSQMGQLYDRLKIVERMASLSKSYQKEVYNANRK